MVIDSPVKMKRTWETEFLYPYHCKETVFHVRRGDIDKAFLQKCIVMSNKARGDLPILEQVLTETNEEFYILLGNEVTGLDSNVVDKSRVSLNLGPQVLSLSAAVNIAMWEISKYIGDSKK